MLAPWRVAVGMAAGATFTEVPTEEDALNALKDPALLSSCDAEEAAGLMGRGWWTAARDLVTRSHGGAKDAQVAIEKVVRREVTTLKQKSDELLLALAPKEEEKIGTVRCSFQWAQNSSALFFQIKHSHRWSSPGALSTHDETFNVEPCCLNYTALGTHSQLNKRYALSLPFFKDVDPEHWSWKPAAAGRFTMEIRKKEPGKWQRLLLTKEKPGNMAMWESMHSQWHDEVEEFEKAEKRRHRAQSKKADEVKQEEEEEDLEAQHEAGASKCRDNRESPFYGSSALSRLCDDYWPPRMKGKKGKEALWVVLFLSPRALKCQERDEECTKVRDWYLALQRAATQQMTDIHFATVNCDLDKTFCQKQEVGHMPFTRKYKNGKRKAYYGSREVDSVMKFLQD